MRYLANSRIAEGVTREQVAQFFSENGFSSEAWQLVQHRIVTEYVFKVGDVPGVVMFMEVESLDEASEVVDGLPIVQRGLITFDLDPIGMGMRF